MFFKVELDEMEELEESSIEEIEEDNGMNCEIKIYTY